MKKTYLEAWDMTDPDLFSAIDEAPVWSAPFGQVLLDTVILKPGLKALDVGCGLGYPALDLAGRLGERACVVGLDPCRPGLDRMLFKMRQYRLNNVWVALGVAERMPFSDGVFNVLISNNGLNNVADETAAYAECYRVGSASAQMVSTVNLPDSMIEFYDVYETVLCECGLSDRVEAMHAQIRSKRKPLEQTCRLISDTGFVIETISEHAFTLRYADGSAMLRHFLIRLAFLPGFVSILDESMKESVMELLEIRLNEQALSKGELCLTIPFVCIDSRKK